MPTSEYDDYYNCIAWAMRDKRRWWEPDAYGLRYWPSKARRDYTLEAFLEAFQTQHFVVCDDGSLEPDYEKIAIYWRSGDDDEDGFQHVARQLPDGQWTSKLGKARDITHHDLDDLAGDYYGEVIRFMRRPRAQTSKRAKRTRARKRRTRS